jgi:putative membrane protein insertion efficiency factor
MGRLIKALHKGIKELFLLPTHIYRALISPWLPRSCIYTPSCSAYLVTSVRTHGVAKGTLLGLARIGRCHHTLFWGGPDPIPEKFSWKAIKNPYIIFRKHRHKKSK